VLLCIFFQAGDGIRVRNVTGVQTCALPIYRNMAYGGNNHGSMVEIMGKWYIFYHRHTDGTNFSRQGCIEPISFREDGSIVQAEQIGRASWRERVGGTG